MSSKRGEGRSQTSNSLQLELLVAGPIRSLRDLDPGDRTKNVSFSRLGPCWEGFLNPTNEDRRLERAEEVPIGSERQVRVCSLPRLWVVNRDTEQYIHIMHKHVGLPMQGYYTSAVTVITTPTTT